MESILLVVISRLSCTFIKQICLKAPMETIEEYFNSREIVEGQIMKIKQLFFPLASFLLISLPTLPPSYCFRTIINFKCFTMQA